MDQTRSNAIILKKKITARPVYNHTALIDISIAYPQVVMKSNPPVSSKISDFYRQTALNYYNYAMDKLYHTALDDYHERKNNRIPFHTYTAMMTYEVPLNLNGLLSITYDIYEFTGGAHGNTVKHADTWNMLSGNRLDLSDYFISPSYKSIIFHNITAQISDQIAQGNNYYFDNYQTNVFKYFNENNYYLTPDGFAFFYPLYTIAPYVAGIVTFIVPYEKFDGYYTPEMKNWIKALPDSIKTREK